MGVYQAETEFFFEHFFKFISKLLLLFLECLRIIYDVIVRVECDFVEIS